MQAHTHTHTHLLYQKALFGTALSPQKTLAVMGRELHYSNFYSTQIMRCFAETFKN